MTRHDRFSQDRGQPLSERRPGEQWQAQFPYHWDADALVSRRELLKLAVSTSGALFFATSLLALLGLRQQPEQRTAPQPIARAGEVPEGEAVYFHYPGPDDEAVLLHRSGGQFVAFSRKCTHLACSVYYQPEQDRLLCPCHDGVFDPQTGAPVAGPPQRPLPRILLEDSGGVLSAVGRRP